MNLAITQQRLKKYKESVVTLTGLMKTSQDRNLTKAKMFYLRGKAFFMLKYFQHALQDFGEAKGLYQPQYQKEISDFMKESKK